MNIQEALAYINCKDISTLDQRTEVLLFELKQKILTKPFHPRVYKKYKEEINKLHDVISFLYGTESSQMSNEQTFIITLENDNPSIFISSYLTIKQKVMLEISMAKNFISLSHSLSKSLALNREYAQKWLPYNKQDLILERSLISSDGMEWVKIKNWILDHQMDNWDEMNKVVNHCDELKMELKRFSNFYPLGKT